MLARRVSRRLIAVVARAPTPLKVRQQAGENQAQHSPVNALSAWSLPGGRPGGGPDA